MKENISISFQTAKPSRKVKRHTSLHLSVTFPLLFSFCSSSRHGSGLTFSFDDSRAKKRSRATGRYRLQKIHHLLWNTHTLISLNQQGTNNGAEEARLWLHKEQHPYEYILNAHSCATTLLQDSPRPALQRLRLSWTRSHCNYHIRRWDIGDIKEAFHHNGWEPRGQISHYTVWQSVMTGRVPKTQNAHEAKRDTGGQNLTSLLIFKR